ncbi:DUF4352 domain-containing protein [Planococcus lenghuensis]|uniref:DUF4352 domain-containing protein n=1 Tax=Planococcus lenghuensis TaxID=2213202 RepID=A0A1Q2KVN2_9BACL|nr:DUF4352 domain-containing protein [Planococcus lenghuensis]AQQ52203.1 hypothetical protein B0X71_03125 [Planococcus lenghuensis]
MKRASLIGFTLAALLAGCSEQADTPAVSEQPEAGVSAAASHIAIPGFYEGYIVNPQVTDDRTLTETGAVFRDARGQIELLAAALDGDTVEIGGIELTVHAAKLLSYQPDYSLTDYYHHFTEAEEFPIINAFIEIRNTTDAPLKFAPVALASADTGEEYTWEDDIYLEELNGEIAPGETVKGHIGFVLDGEDTRTLTLTTSDVFNTEDEKIADANELTIDF